VMDACPGTLLAPDTPYIDPVVLEIVVNGATAKSLKELDNIPGVAIVKGVKDFDDLKEIARKMQLRNSEHMFQYLMRFIICVGIPYLFRSQWLKEKFKDHAEAIDLLTLIYILVIMHKNPASPVFFTWHVYSRYFKRPRALEEQKKARVKLEEEIKHLMKDVTRLVTERANKCAQVENYTQKRMPILNITVHSGERGMSTRSCRRL